MTTGIEKAPGHTWQGDVTVAESTSEGVGHALGEECAHCFILVGVLAEQARERTAKRRPGRMKLNELCNATVSIRKQRQTRQ